MQALAQVELFPPFAGPIPVRVERPRNPEGPGALIITLALVASGIGFGWAAHRMRSEYGRMQCHDFGGPLVGVPLDFQGDWWEVRGRRLYWQARRAGETTPTGIARAILAADLGASSPCLAQFPPGKDTLPRNAELWAGMMDYVQREMSAERAP